MNAAQQGSEKITQMFDQLPDIHARPNSSQLKSGIRSQQISVAPGSSSKPSPAKKAGGPLGPSDALVKYKRVLTKYEHNEIKEYPQIFYVGPTAKKINAAEGKGKNCGYDDEKGRYKCVKNDHIGYRYEVMKGLGKGSFGDVVKGFDHKLKTDVAIKIIRNERRFHKQAQSEVKILDMLRKQDKRDNHNVIHMKDFFLFRGHLCITFEMMKCDLYCQLKKDGFKGFPQEVIKDYTKALVTSLRVLRRSRIIHCDLKPENILIRADGSSVKIIDFGSSCFDHQRVHTYIQSRFYRSPEVIMGLGYGVPIDMWSLGCILAELHTGQPLFPGHNEKEQLMYQMETLGVPPAAVIDSGKRSSTFFSADYEPLHLQDRKGRTRKPGTRSLEKALSCKDPAFQDFIARCLTWDPAERMTPREAAHHEYITGQSAGQGDMMSLIPKFANSMTIGKKMTVNSGTRM